MSGNELMSCRTYRLVALISSYPLSEKQTLSRANGLNQAQLSSTSEPTTSLVRPTFSPSLFSPLETNIPLRFLTYNKFHSSDATKKSGQRLVGDVDYASALPVASHITPVPGGVGPMTVALLMDNTLKSAERLWTKARQRRVKINPLKLLEKVPRCVIYSSSFSLDYMFKEERRKLTECENLAILRLLVLKRQRELQT